LGTPVSSVWNSCEHLSKFRDISGSKSGPLGDCVTCRAKPPLVSREKFVYTL
jgi:hypothetical protein